MKTANIWAVGRNYADHAKELNNPLPKEPLVFLKAGSTATTGEAVQWPALFDGDIHHELELALRFGEDLRFDAMMLALDLTARELQARLKGAGQPWTLAKSFRGSCPLSSPVPLPVGAWSNEDFLGSRLELKVNGELRQSGRLAEMIFSPPVLSEWVRARFPVRPGDLLLTGTPAGVGPLRAGDQLEGLLTSPTQHLWLRHLWRVQPPT